MQKHTMCSLQNFWVVDFILNTNLSSPIDTSICGHYKYTHVVFGTCIFHENENSAFVYISCTRCFCETAQTWMISKT